MGGVKGEGHDGCGVAAVGEMGVNAGAGACPVVAVARIYSAFFGAGEEVCGVFGRECDAGRCDLVGFAGRGRGEFEVLLRLREHVDGPGTDDAIGRA